VNPRTMNLKRGLFRLAIVLSPIAGLLCCFERKTGGMLSGPYYTYTVWEPSERFLIGFLGIWLLYFATKFILRGFSSKQEKK